MGFTLISKIRIAGLAGENNSPSRRIHMKALSVKLFTVCLAIGMLSLPGAAGRKHGDVENIGNRSVSGRVFGILPNFVSLEKEIKIGQEVAQEFEQTARMVEDPVISEYVDRIGQNIVKHSDAKVPFYIKVVDTDEVNAFAFPGGFFYVNKGLLLAADNESELAGVMAHEISHVTARHATQRLSKGQYLQLGTLPLLFVGGYWAQMGIQNGYGIGHKPGTHGDHPGIRTRSRSAGHSIPLEYRL